MVPDSAPTTLAPGSFFGRNCHNVRVPSFHFAELQATVPERRVPIHTHEMPHFILVMEGRYVTGARNQDGICGPATLIFNPAGTTHRDCFRSSRGRFLSITPSAEVARLLESAPPVSVIVTGASVRNPEAARLIEGIVREMRGADLSDGIMEPLGLELIGLMSNRSLDSSPHAPGWLFVAREMIEDCFDRELSMAEVAANVGVHPVYFARAYRRYFSCSPGEHLRHCRFLRARSLLAKTELPLAEVALESGFSDQSQMTRFFSEFAGISPARYRRLHQP